MTVVLERSSNGDYYLNIAILNTEKMPLTLYEADLPWKGPTSMTLVAVKTDALGSVLERAQLIDDPGPAKTSIKADEKKQGKILLNARFPNLKESVKERDVIVFWSYQLSPIGAAPHERVGGWLLIHKEN